MPVRILDWSTLGENGVDIVNGASVDTGGVAVTFGFDAEDEGAQARNFEFAQNNGGNENIDPTEGVKLGGLGGEGGSDDTSTTTLDFSSTNEEFGDEVENVTFFINDIDQSAPGGDYQDIVSIRAFDADGNEVPVQLTAGGDILLDGNTATGNDETTVVTSPENPATSLQVEIPGPVARIEIDYNNGGTENQSVWVTDVEFSTTPAIIGETDAVDDVIVTDEDTPESLVLTANDTDPQGDDLEITSVDTTGLAGTVTVDPDADTVTYDPNGAFESLREGETATETFTYTITDGDGNEDTATVTVTINGVNDDPTANDDEADLVAGTPSVTIPVLDNDTDPEDPNGLTIDSVEQPANGTVTINDDGTLTYTPNPGTPPGDDSFTYTVVDPDGGTSTATVTINGPENNAVEAVDDVIVTDEDTPGEVVATANDIDPDGDDIEITGVDTTGILGDVTIDPDNDTLVYDPNGAFESLGEGETATETFTYTVTDGNGNEDTATVTVTINGVNDAPDAVDDTGEVPVGGASVTIPVLANDTDPELDTLTVSSVGEPANGTATLNDDGTVTYTPDPTFSGTDTFTYTITDPDGAEDTATVTVTVGGPAPDGFVDGTSGDDIIDDMYDGDPNGDFVDANDALLPGEVGNDDIIRAGDGNDSVTAGDGDDEVLAGNGNDTVDGGVGDDEILGEDGDDELIGSEGNDTIDGGDGDDLIDAGAPGLGLPDAPTFEGIPTDDTPNDDLDSVSGGAGNDTISTGDDADTIDGGIGDDVLDGGIDNDVIDGGDGNDSILGGQGADDITGGAGDDTIDAGQNTFSDYPDDPNLPNPALIDPATGLPAEVDPNQEDNRDTVSGGEGNDLINTGDDADLVFGDEGNDTIDAGIDDDTVEGGTGDDVIIGGPGSDSILGGDGDDLINAGDPAGLGPQAPDETDPFPDNGLDFVDGGAGNDTILGEDDDDTLIGGTGDDSIDGGLDDDSITGDAGNDTLIGGDGSDTVEGGDGNDVIDTSGPDALPDNGFDAGNPGGIDADLLPDNDRDLVIAGAGDDVVTTGDDADTIEGGDGADLIDAGIDDDLVDGGEGDDEITAGEGQDTVTGGAGNDVIFGDNSTDDPLGVELPNDGTDPEPTNNEDSLNGGAGDDSIFGEDDNDTLIGGEGDDFLDGGVDDDSLNGGVGNDTLIGGDGSDTVGGGDGNDFIDTTSEDELPDEGFDDPTGVPVDDDPDDNRDLVTGGMGDDTIATGDDADTIFGGFGNDVIDGGIDDDEIDGAVGNDSIIGGEGDDLILGGTGDDTIEGDTGPFGDELPNDGTDPEPTNNEDTISGGSGNDVINGGDDNDVLNGGIGDDTIDGGVDDDEIRGNDGNDLLIGGDGDDSIFGGNGNDTLSGGDGEDLLEGRADRDVFEDVGAGDTVDGGTGGDDFDTLDLTGIGNFEIVDRTVDPDGDSTSGTINLLDDDGNALLNEDGTPQQIIFTEIENLIPCFTPGTVIATPRGERRVEDLREGDRIITRDNGLQEVRWVGHRALSGQELVQQPNLKPVLIRAGALGHGLPERDLLVSPQHRVLMNSDRAALYFEEREVLAAAKHLTDLEGVDVVESSSTTYIHFMFDQHEVVLSNGSWTESFQPGEQVMDGMGNEQRDEIYTLFPELREKDGLDNYQAARRSLKKHEAKLLVK